jgi:hypothetical protein
MTIKRIVNNPTPPEVPNEEVVNKDFVEWDVVNPSPSSIAYDDWPEPLRSAVKSGRVDVTTLPYPVFDQLTGILNPLINLDDYA